MCIGVHAHAREKKDATAGVKFPSCTEKGWELRLLPSQALRFEKPQTERMRALCVSYRGEEGEKRGQDKVRDRQGTQSFKMRKKRKEKRVEGVFKCRLRLRKSKTQLRGGVNYWTSVEACIR